MNDLERAVAAAIADGLRTSLVHPGNPATNQDPIAIPLPAFKTTGMPPQMADHVGTTTQLIAEAIVALIGTKAALVDPAELDNLRATAANADAQPADNIVVECRHCHTALVHLTMRDPTRSVVDGRQLLGMLAHRDTNCPHTTTGAP